MRYLILLIVGLIAGSPVGMPAQEKIQRKPEIAGHADKKKEKPDGKSGTSTVEQVVEKSGKVETPSASERAVGKTADGKTVYEGSQGGHYYLHAGKKVYIKDFAGQNVVGKTASGQPIFDGGGGTRFYYNANGDKVYIKK